MERPRFSANETTQKGRLPGGTKRSSEIKLSPREIHVRPLFEKSYDHPEVEEAQRDRVLHIKQQFGIDTTFRKLPEGSLQAK